MKTGARPEATPDNSERPPLPGIVTVGLPLILLIGVFFYHWMKVFIFALDIPFWDEWDVLPQKTAWDWVWGQHVEHRIVTTRLLITAIYNLNRWDFATQQMLNFGIFGIVIGALYMLLRQGGKALPAGLALLLLVFPLSPRASEVHHWGITVHFHFALLFLFGSIYLLFKERDGGQSSKDLLLGALFGILSIYSFGTGLSAMVVVTFIYGLYKVRRARQDVSKRGQELKQLALVAGLILLALAAYGIGYQKLAGESTLTLPFQRAFWDFWLTMLAYGMGFRFSLGGSYAVGLLYVALIVLPWLLFIGNAHRGRAAWDSTAWAILAGTISILGALALTAAGRGGTGYEQAQVSRYTETTMMLIPLIGASWWLALSNTPKIRMGVLAGYVVLSAIGFGLTWKSIDDYEMTYLIRRNEAQRLSGCYNAGVACKVPNLYPAEITIERLNKARAMKYSFMDKVMLRNW